jgi:hypothetical protein
MYRNCMYICVYLMYFRMGKLSYHKQRKLATDFSDIRLRLFSCISYCTRAVLTLLLLVQREQNSYIFLGVCQY